MTVCIGALCEAGKSVVVAADRMVTFGPPMNLQAEPPTLKKIFKASESCVLLFSGGVSDGEELISNVQRKLTGAQNPQVGQIAEVTKSYYVELKKKRVEEKLGQHTATSSLAEAVFNVHEAKKSSEVAPGVGKFTDMAIVRNGKIFELKPELLAILEQVHKEKPALTKGEWEQIGKACDESTK
ncbi:MAG: hypothetical protein WBN75_07315 [Verrucomicrobiia bacterium]